MGPAAAVRLGPASAAQHAHLERLKSSARSLLGLVDVRDAAKCDAKVDADRLEVRQDALMTGAVVTAVLTAAVTPLQSRTTAKGVRLGSV
jgi:hypothetical protein